MKMNHNQIAQPLYVQRTPHSEIKEKRATYAVVP